ncbi:MAG: glycosyltransferase family 2 protein [Bradymonadales bacterium]|nr:MAG: glycosyltransferase family 2 protein [Bradymonadales bacterium]
MSVSVVIPCLNEEETIEACVREAREAFPSESDEIIVVDNGSTDRSFELAKAAGAKVIQERRRGYGSAILRGFQEAQADILIMGDADLSYDFHDAKRLVEKLREEDADFAIGSRLRGKIEKGAMPWLHQKFGTPLLTGFLNLIFGTRLSDINCGLRAFKKSCLEKMNLRSPGMEFASEMVIHAQKAGLKFVEAPIKLRKRGGGVAKLRTFRDGWRHLRFILYCAPFSLFVLPALLGLAVSAWCFWSPRFGYQVMGSFVLISSFQVLSFGLMAKTFLWVSDSFLVDRGFARFIESFRLEYGILGSLGVFGAGVLVLQGVDLRSLILGFALVALGIQIFFSSFFVSILLSKASREST